VIAGTRAGNVQQVPFGVVDLLQIGIIPDRLNTILLGDDLIVADHHCNCPKLKSLRF
jgi:hypothetical protein